MSWAPKQFVEVAVIEDRAQVDKSVFMLPVAGEAKNGVTLTLSRGHRLLHIAGDNRVKRGEFDNPSTHPIYIWDATPLPSE